MSNQEDERLEPVLSKRTLTALSNAIEELACGAGSDAILISLFQRGVHFEQMVARYEQIAASGCTVIVAYCGPGPTAAGVHHVTLEESHPLANDWGATLLTPTLASHVRGRDLNVFDSIDSHMESGRKFATSWALDRPETAVHADWLISHLAASLDPAVVATTRLAIADAYAATPTAAESALAAATMVLIQHLEANHRDLNRTRAELARESELASRDSLTGLLNREGLERWLNGHGTKEFESPPTALILLDLDNFKRINDQHGHLTGDRLLKSIAQGLTNSVRPIDVVCRWGGDEFVILCPALTNTELEAVARRLIAAVAQSEIDGISVTASIGAQQSSRNPFPLDRVDTALYDAKAIGGGQLVIVEAQ